MYLDLDLNLKSGEFGLQGEKNDPNAAPLAKRPQPKATRYQSVPVKQEKDRFPRSLASAENGFSDRGGFQGGGLRATKTSPAPEGDGRFCRASLAESETSVGSAVSFIPV